MEGWKSWETWNCALWLDNTEFLYDNFVKRSHSYSDLVKRLKEQGITETPDGAAYEDADLEEMEEHFFTNA